MNDITNVIRARRSVRKYKAGAEIPQDDLRLILEAAMMAPSACNTRPWEFVVIKSQDVREKITAIHPYTKMLPDASVGIVVCGLGEIQEGIAKGFWPQDCAAAIENMLLQATGLGYGSCWCGIYPSEQRVQAVKEIIGVKSTPVAVVAIGVAEEAPKQRGFYDESKVTYID